MSDGPGAKREAFDDTLVWFDAPQPGELGLLADCDALVAAGLAEWIEPEPTEDA